MQGYRTWRVVIVSVILLCLAPVRGRAAEPVKPSAPRTLRFDQRVDTFSNPSRVSSDHDGNLYVSDLNDRRVYMYGPDLNYVRALGTGTIGSEPGDLSEPQGTVRTGSLLWVVDSANNRVEYFDLKNGTVGYVLTGVLRRPRGIAVAPDGGLYVADTGNHRLVKFNPNGVTLATLGGALFAEPRAVAVDAQGYVYVSDYGANRIVKFAPNGIFLMQFGLQVLNGPDGITIDPTGLLYVVDRGNRRIVWFDWTGQLRGSFAPGDLPRAGLIDPTDVAVVSTLTTRPRIMVADVALRQVNAYSLTTVPTEHRPFAGWAVGPVNGLSLDEQGNLYSTDPAQNRVQKFDPNGTVLAEFGSYGHADGQFDRPGGVAVSGTGQVYVTDMNNRRVQVFDSAGTFIRQFGGLFSQPHRIAIDSLNQVYVTDDGSGRLLKFSAAGDFIEGWSIAPIRQSAGLALNPVLRLMYVLDAQSGQIMVFSTTGERLRLIQPDRSSDLPGTALAADRSGNLYLAQAGLLRQITLSGQTLSVLSEGDQPAALAYNAVSGQLYAAGGTQIRRYGSVRRQQDSIGIWRPSTTTFSLWRGAGETPATIDLPVAGARDTDRPVAGDWNGDGITTVGLYRPSSGFFYLWDRMVQLNMDTPDHLVPLGDPGDQPLAGDWNADGVSSVGSYRPSTGLLYLKDTLSGRASDYVMVFGDPGDIGVAGDWDGDGQTSTGVYRPGEGRFYLSDRNHNGILFSDYERSVGEAGNLPITGDFAASGKTGLGVFRPATGEFLLRASVDSTAPEQVIRFGEPGDQPLSGAWGPLPDAAYPVLPLR